MSKNLTSSWGESITCANLAHVRAAADATSSVLEHMSNSNVQILHITFPFMILNLSNSRGVTVANFATVQSELWNRCCDSKLAFL